MTAPTPSAAPKGRLGNGQLRRQVAGWLAARPGPHTPGEIAKDLGRSAGAVGNALTTLAGRGEADRLAGKPIRYQANSSTAAAAAAITLKAPRNLEGAEASEARRLGITPRRASGDVRLIAASLYRAGLLRPARPGGPGQRGSGPAPPARTGMTDRKDAGDR